MTRQTPAASSLCLVPNHRQTTRISHAGLPLPQTPSYPSTPIPRARNRSLVFPSCLPPHCLDRTPGSHRCLIARPPTLPSDSCQGSLLRILSPQSSDKHLSQESLL
ncbi:hypothetical protein LX36DRAFT_214337 [Colletotrichum falcatum]|nr:hypothetical protein LX36DRAFT_214337 [Colletotrichum falcatum]